MSHEFEVTQTGVERCRVCRVARVVSERRAADGRPDVCQVAPVPQRPQRVVAPREHRRLLDERRVLGLLEELEGLLRTLRTGETSTRGVRVPPAVAVVGWGRMRAGDSLPRGGGGGGSPSTVVDEHGLAMPPLSDPVGELVVADPLSDPVRRAALDVARTLSGAVGDLRVAVGALHAAKRAHGSAVVADDSLWCVAHLRAGLVEPKGDRGDRCRWCYEFSLAHGQDPPRSLLELRLVKPRITQRDVEQALGRRAS